MLGYYFVGNIWVRSDFRLFLVDGGHSWINHESMGSIVCWIMLGSSIRSIMWWFHCMRLEKEGPTLVSLCVFYYFSSLALTINLYIFLHHISFEAVLISPCSLWDNPVYEASQYASGKYCPLRVPGSPSTGPRARGIAPSTRAPELANMC